LLIHLSLEIFEDSCAEEMGKAEHNACLSTSMSSSLAPPCIVETSPETGRSSRRRRTVAEGRGGATAKTTKPGRRRPDYVLVLAYILLYLEVGWLIFVVLRMYSRD